MVEFDFEQNGGGTALNTSFTNAFTLDFTFTDVINFTGSSVKFGVSYSGSFSVTSTSVFSLFASITDNPGAGIGISNSAVVGPFSSSISASTQFLTFSLKSPTAGGNTAFSGVATLETSGGDTYTAMASGNTVTFNISGVGFGANISTLTVNLACFCAGTQIATPGGTSAVETLQTGDTVRLADGRDVNVRWVGRQHVDTRLHHPKVVNPICITAGSLGGGLPERNLRVSADHGIYVDGMLINAGALVNGTTIYQERDISLDGFTYYHVETDAHELIVAEGVAAESFIDYEERDAFENGHEGTKRVINEMDLPRVSSRRLVPEAIRQRLAPAIAAE